MANLPEDVRRRLGPEVSDWIEGYAVSAPDVETGDETPASVAEDMVGLFDRHAREVARRAIVEARDEIARLRAEVQRLMAIESSCREWTVLASAPPGKYDGPSVLRARDRLRAALTEIDIRLPEDR